VDDSLYQKALVRRSELLEQIRNIEIFINEYQRLKGLESSQGHDIPELLFSSKSEASFSEQTKNKISVKKQQKRAKNPKPAEIIESVKRILRAQQRPMTRTELLKALAERGVVVSGVDPAKVLGTNLWRSDQIERAETGGYWIKGEPMLPNLTKQDD